MMFTLHDIVEKDDVLIVTIPNTKTQVIRKFIVCNYDDSDTRYTDLYKKHKLLRPDNTTHRRFFVAYKDGKCTKQCKVPCKIAVYLGLQDPEMYTGHCHLQLQCWQTLDPISPTLRDTVGGSRPQLRSH